MTQAMFWPIAHAATPNARRHYAAIRQLIADYRAYRNDEIVRPCEVQRQVIGNPQKYSPAR